MTGPTQERSERELRELLPFFVNGSLDGEELAAVEAYLAGSEAAREEVTYLERLRHAIKTQPQMNSPGELGLKRLQREMSQNAKGAAGTGARASGLAQAAQQSASAGVAVWWRNLAVAACLALAVVTTLSVTDWPSGDGDLHLASGGGDADLQVTFKPQATEEIIRALLLEIGASITEGPSTLGVYRLRLEPDAGDAALARALQQLRARGDVVESAEPE